MASDYKDHWLKFSKKVLDKQVSLEYNEFIKSEERFLAHSPNEELDYGYL